MFKNVDLTAWSSFSRYIFLYTVFLVTFQDRPVNSNTICKPSPLVLHDCYVYLKNQTKPDIKQFLTLYS